MKKWKFISRYEVLALLGAVSYNFIVYYGGRAIAHNFTHYDFTTSLDMRIPLIPWTIVIYLGCFLFWGVNYDLAVRFDRAEGGRFLLAHVLGEGICFLTFILLPTTMTRPEITGHSLADWILRIQYTVDQPDNLLPSIHCFASWLSWIGVRSNARVPRWYRSFSLFFALAVCVSTLTVKQHVLLDVVTGVALAELSYLVAGVITRLVRRHTERVGHRTRETVYRT